MLPIDHLRGLLGVSVIHAALLCCCFLPVAAGAAALPETMRQVWTTSINEEAFEVEFRGVTVSSANLSIWMVLGRRPKGNIGGDPVYSLQVVGKNGDNQSEISLAALAKTAKLRHAPDRILDVAALSDGSIAVVVQSDTQIAILLMDAETHHLIQVKELSPSGPTVSVFRVLPVESANLLLIGKAAGKATVVKLDAKFNVIWQRSVADSRVPVYTDGAVLSDGTYLFAGSLLSKADDAASPVSLWLERVTQEGKTESSTQLPGQNVSVAAAGDGGFSLVQHVTEKGGVDIWFRSYDRTLKEVWSANLLTATRNFEPFQIALIPGTANEFMVVGSNRHTLWLSRVVAGSSVTPVPLLAGSSGPGAMPQLIWNVGIRASASSLIVPTTDLIVDAKMQQREAVRVTNLAP